MRCWAFVYPHILTLLLPRVLKIKIQDKSQISMGSTAEEASFEWPVTP